MNINEFFIKIRNDLQDKLYFLEDKPEETLESTIMALWMMAAGFPLSAEKAIESRLPELTMEQQKELNNLIEIRLANIPLAHITKRQNFMGIELITDERALIPRKETEILGKKALDMSFQISDFKSSIKVFDVCCGSGNLGIAVSHYNYKCTVYAADLSKEAVELARENVAFTNLNKKVKVIQSDLFSEFMNDEFYEKVDLIICNPPYISSSKVIKMDSEISANEPSLAFDGGMMGIKIIQKLISDAPLFLTPGGWLIFEVGVGQGDFVIKLLQKAISLKNISSVSDDSGNIRVVFAQKAQLIMV